MDLDLLIMLCKNEQENKKHLNPNSSATVELFHRALGGEEKARVAFVELIAPYVYIYSEQILSRHSHKDDSVDANDIAQDVLLNLWKVSTQVISHDNFAAYIHRCIKNQLGQAIRGSKGKIVTISLDESSEWLLPQSNSLTTERIIELKDLEERYLQTHLQTEEERMVYLWYFVQQYKRREVIELYKEHFPQEKAPERRVDQVKQNILHRWRTNGATARFFQELTGRNDFPNQNFGDIALFTIEPLNKRETLSTKGIYDVSKKCDLNEFDLLDYISGRASAEIVATIQKSPVCQQAVQLLANEMLPIFQTLYRLPCPSVETLLDYQEQRLNEVEYRTVTQHVLHCLHCQEEIKLFAAVDEVASQSKQAVDSLIDQAVTKPIQEFVKTIRRNVEALLRPPMQLAQPVLGGMLRYESDEYAIDLMSTPRKISGKPRTWSLRGQVHQLDKQLDQQIEQVILCQLDTANPVQLVATLDNEEFVFKDLQPGTYTLHVLTPDQEIEIKEIHVGD